MPALKYFEPGSDPVALIAALEHDGGAILQGALAAPELARLDGDCRDLLAGTAQSEGVFHGFRTRRVGAMVGKSRVCQTMALHPAVIAVMDHFLLSHCLAYQLNLSQLIAVGADERRQVNHTDDAMFPFVNRHFQAMINVMWAVDDFTAANGATLIAPGSHGWDRDRRALDEELVPAEMPAGSCAIYFGSTRHAAGANRTDRERRGVVISYCLGWLRQSENQYLAIPRDVARAMPEPLQRLIGYFVHMPNLGTVEGQDPIALLREEGVGKAGFQDFLPDESIKAIEDFYARRAAAGLQS